MGGTNIATDKRKLKDGAPPQILVGTPGRLNDLLENEGLAARLKVSHHPPTLRSLTVQPSRTGRRKVAPSWHSRKVCPE